MAVTIRLRRVGGKNEVFFQVVACDSRRARNGKMIEQLGHYDPKPKAPVFKLDHQRYGFWVQKGAQVSRTVKELVARNPGEPAAQAPAAAPAAQG
jgi:small subunit ribosomal protein S16